jgi:copper homeostasis protein
MMRQKMGQRILLEVIAASLDDALAAAEGGADRLELCSALALGGLTPTLGTLYAIKAAVQIPVMCMLRPREGGMAYSDREFDVMRRDAELLLEAGADGLVFGFLSADGEIDIDRCSEILDLLRQTSSESVVQAVFHRAFDVVADPVRALEELIDLDFDRVLTSGRAPTALEGIEVIRQAVEQADGRIQILPAGGIDFFSVERIVAGTGVDQVHVYIPEVLEDRSVTRNPRIYFGAHVLESELEFRRVSPPKVRRVRTLLDRGSSQEEE